MSRLGTWSRTLLSRISRGFRRYLRTAAPAGNVALGSHKPSADRAAAVNVMARDPSLGLDYVVCGMPRGGTTFFAELLNAHPDLYCYFMETAVFRQLWMFGADRPYPLQNLGILEDWLRAQLEAQLLDATDPELTARYRLRLVPFLEMLNAHGLTEETGPGLRVFDKDSAEELIQDLLALFRQGLYGPELFQAGNRVLGAYLRRRTARRIVGEKTPDNLFSLDLLMAGNADLQVLCVVREPFTTMESMKRRAQQEESIFNAAFSSNFFGALADYYRSLSIIVSSLDRLPPGRFHVIRYEDLLEDPERILERALGVFSLVPTDATRQIASNFIIPTPTAHSPREVFTDQDIAIADYVLRPLLRRVGYGEDFFRGRGLSVDEGSCSDLDQELIVPLRGVRQEAAASAGVEGWIEDTAELLLLFLPGRSRLDISVDSDFPSQLGADTFYLTAAGSGDVLAELAVGPGAQHGKLEIDLARLESEALGAGWKAATLSLTASHAYRPITIPGMGSMMDRLSFRISAKKYD